jgi:hypothetical protein
MCSTLVDTLRPDRYLAHFLHYFDFLPLDNHFYPITHEQPYTAMSSNVSKNLLPKLYKLG